MRTRRWMKAFLAWRYANTGEAATMQFQCEASERYISMLPLEFLPLALVVVA